MHKCDLYLSEYKQSVKLHIKVKELNVINVGEVLRLKPTTKVDVKQFTMKHQHTSVKNTERTFTEHTNY